MSTTPAVLRMVEASGAEALWWAEGAPPVSAAGDEIEAAPHRRTLTGWIHGPHDTRLRLHPMTLTGFRLARVEA